MGKHETGYARQDRDFYPTSDWPIEALAEQVELRAASAFWNALVETAAWRVSSKWPALTSPPSISPIMVTAGCANSKGDTHND